MKFRRFPVFLTALAFASGLAHGDGLPVTPGLWKSQSTVQISFVAPGQVAPTLEPEVRASQSCVSDASHVLDAGSLAGPGCEASDITTIKDGISFVLVCQRTDATLYGTMTAKALAGGSQTLAHMTLTGRSADGREMKIDAEMVGERLGPCEH